MIRQAPIKSSKQGFTLVELIVVVATLSILVSITIFLVGDWRGRSAQTEVKNGLANAAAAMEDARNFTNAYPSSIPSTYIASPNVSMQLYSQTSTSFCLNGWSTSRTDIKYYMKNQSSAVAGVCP